MISLGREKLSRLRISINALSSCFGGRLECVSASPKAPSQCGRICHSCPFDTVS